MATVRADSRRTEFVCVMQFILYRKCIPVMFIMQQSHGAIKSFQTMHTRVLSQNVGVNIYETNFALQFLVEVSAISYSTSVLSVILIPLYFLCPFISHE